jgi:Raf kinase inhibitor-like YbhB/YbcL family protein
MVEQSDKAGWGPMRSSPPARRRSGAAVLVVLALTVAASGCDTGDGRDLADPPPGATAPPLVTTTVPAPTTQDVPAPGSEGGPGSLLLGSPAFAAGGEIPARFSCEGDDVSPPLGWVNVPEGTVELAVTVVDPDAPSGQFVHWVVTGLDPALGGLDEGEVPETAVEARNDISEFGWYGPCPPSGETHAYVFTLFALSAPSGVQPGASGADAIATVAATPGVATILTGTYTGA